MSKNKIADRSYFLLKNIIFAIISIFLFFLTVEIIFRLIGFASDKKYNKDSIQLFQMGNPLRAVDPTAFGRYDKDKDLFWKLQPNPDDEVNNYRYRGVKRDYNKSQEVYRIILIGDSCAYGIMVKNSDTYAYLLEKKLNNNAETGKFEVLNAGVPGYSSLQGKRYLENELIKYHPDMVLVGFGFNDLCDAVNRTDKDLEISPGWAITLDNYLSKTKFYVFLKKIIFSCKEKLVGGFSYKQNKYSNLEEINDLSSLIRAQSMRDAFPLKRVPPADFAANIKEIIKMGKEYKFKVILLTLPSISGCFGYGQMLKLLAGEYHVGIIDLIEEFKAKGANTQEYFIDNNHYNEKGHLLVADIICAHIKK